MASDDLIAIRFQWVIPDSDVTFELFEYSFVLLEFADYPASAYAETYAAGVFVDDRPAVEAYYEVVAQLQQAALSEGQSREMLVRLAGEYERA